MPPDMQILAERIENTPPAKFNPAWLPSSASARWKWIIIHHSGTLNGSAAAFDRYHTNDRKMENGLAYHFVIGNGSGSDDGVVEIGNRWKEQLDGGHIDGAKLDHTSIGICLVGDFEQIMPTEKQIASLKALLITLKENFNISNRNIKGHNAMPKEQTACPGMCLPTSDILKHLK